MEKFWGNLSDQVAFVDYCPCENLYDIVENTTSHPDANLIQVPKFWNEIKKQYKYQEIIESPNQTSMGIGVLFV